MTNRRKFIAACGTLAVGTLAGCSGDDGDTATPTDGGNRNGNGNGNGNSNRTEAPNNTEIDLSEKFAAAKQSPSGLGSADGNLWVCHILSASDWPSDNIFGVETTGEFLYNTTFNPYYQHFRRDLPQTGPVLSGLAIDAGNTLYLSYLGPNDGGQGDETGIYEAELGQDLQNMIASTPTPPEQDSDVSAVIPEFNQPPGETTGLAISDGLWAASRFESTVWKLDQEYNLVRAISVPNPCKGLAHDGTRLYASSRNDLYVVDNSSGNIESSFSISENISGLAIMNGKLWGCDEDNGGIYEVNIN